MSHDDDYFGELHRLALITRMLDDPSQSLEVEDMFDEEEAAALRSCPNVSTARRPTRKAGRS